MLSLCLHSGSGDDGGGSLGLVVVCSGGGGSAGGVVVVIVGMMYQECTMLFNYYCSPVKSADETKTGYRVSDKLTEKAKVKLSYAWMHL